MDPNFKINDYFLLVAYTYISASRLCYGVYTSVLKGRVINPVQLQGFLAFFMGINVQDIANITVDNYGDWYRIPADTQLHYMSCSHTCIRYTLVRMIHSCSCKALNK